MKSTTAIFLIFLLQLAHPILTASQSLTNYGLKSAVFEDVSSVVSSMHVPAGTSERPFSLGASMASASTLGGQLQLATNVSPHINLRGSYGLLLWKKWVSSDGFTTHAGVTLVSTGMMVDIFPFANRGLRFSPGVIVHNRQFAEGDIPLASPQGGAFVVNGHTYYSASRDKPWDQSVSPQDQGQVHAYEGVRIRPVAMTISTGWGNMVRENKGGHWSFPIELGVALMGSPSVKPGYIYGQICDAEGQNCTGAAKNPQLINDVRAQFDGYKSHLDLLKTYPVISCGVAYRFGLHRRGIQR